MYCVHYTCMQIIYSKHLDKVSFWGQIKDNFVGVIFSRLKNNDERFYLDVFSKKKQQHKSIFAAYKNVK